jgi:hypothetical protein
MSRRLFSHDPVFGITKYWHDDQANDRGIIETVQDVKPILDNNKAERNSGVNKKDHGLGRKVASIPLVLYYKWQAEAKQRGLGPDETNAYIMGMLRSPDYCHLLTVDKI